MIRRRIPRIALSAALGLCAPAAGRCAVALDAVISVRPYAGVPPNVITDLRASTTPAEGQAFLAWTAPGAFPGAVPEAYQLRIQTFSVADIGGSTAAWWNNQTGILFQGLYAQTAGSLITRTVGKDAPDHDVDLGFGATYYYAVRSADDTGLTIDRWSAITTAAVRATDLPPRTPQDFAAVSGDSQVQLTWTDLTTAEKTGDFVYYRLKRSADGMNFVQIATTTAASWLDTGVVNGQRYFYNLTAVDDGPPGPALESSPTFAPAAPNAPSLPPAMAGDITGLLSADGLTFTISWDTVTTNLDGTAITDLAGYRVYKFTGPFSSTAAVFNTAQTWFTDTVNNQVFYYKVRAVDAVGNESPDSALVDSSSSPAVTVICDDGQTSITVPATLGTELRAENNNTGSDLVIVPVRLNADETGNTLKSYRFEIRRAENNQPVTTFSFSRPLINVSFGFTNPARVPPRALTTKKPAIFWYNGARFINLGGYLDLEDGSVSVLSANAGTYQLRLVGAASNTVLADGSPYPRTITPNGDGVNDAVFFFFSATDAAKEGKVYDLRGAYVSGMAPGPVQDASLVWDGRDGGGRAVPAGIYIYKVSIGDETVTGTVVVAR